MKNPVTKPCANCGDLFEKPSDTSQEQWAIRKFCSHRCAIKGRNMVIEEVKTGIQTAMDAVATAMMKWRRCR